jgi:hypothetical protein
MAGVKERLAIVGIVRSEVFVKVAHEHAVKIDDAINNEFESPFNIDLSKWSSAKFEGGVHNQG